MPQVTISVDLPAETIAELIRAGMKVVGKAGQGHAAPFSEVTSAYFRNPGETGGRSGRPSKLNEKGMRAVWGYYTEGYSFAEIARGLRNRISPTGVRNLVLKIKGAKP
jgi:hypothetical protein